MNTKKYCYFSTRRRNSLEVLMYRQGRSLLENDYEVYSVVSDKRPTEIIQGINVLPTGCDDHGVFRRIFIAPFYLLKTLLEVDADVYHTVNIDSLLTCLFLKRKGKNVVFEMREDHPYSLYWKSNAPKWLLKPIVWLLSKWMGFVLRKVDAVMTLTYEEEAYLRSWGIDAQKIHLWGNFPEVRKDYNLPFEDYMKREARVLYFGIIYSYSKQEVFLKAIKDIPEVKYLVAGRFMDNELGSYRKKIISMPEWRDVEFVEGFKHEELDGFILRSTISNVLRDFSAYPMEKSGSFGIIKIFESMEAALPIICSDMPIYREIMKEYKCGILVDPLNEKEIYDAINYLVTHKAEAWRMGQEGRRAVIEKYSWDVLSCRFLSIINSFYYENE